MKQVLTENLIAEVSEDQILTLTTDLKKIVTKTVGAGNDAACSTRGTCRLIEEVGGKFEPTWTVQVHVYRKPKKEKEENASD